MDICLRISRYALVNCELYIESSACTKNLYVDSGDHPPLFFLEVMRIYVGGLADVGGMKELRSVPAHIRIIRIREDDTVIRKWRFEFTSMGTFAYGVAPIQGYTIDDLLAVHSLLRFSTGARPLEICLVLPCSPMGRNII